MRSKGLLTCGMLILLVASVTNAAEPAQSDALREAINKVKQEYNKTNHPYVRAEALLNMGEFDEPAFVDFLVDVLSQTSDIRSNFIIRHTISQRISKLKSEEALERVIFFLGQMRKLRRWNVNKSLLQGLGPNPSPIAARGILEGLKDPNAEVKAEAALYAGRLRDLEAIPLLIETVGDRDKRVKLNAYNALVELTGCKLPVEKKNWEDWWAKNKENIKELPVAKEFRVEEEVTSWPIVEDFNFECRTPGGRESALRANASPAYRGAVIASVEAGLKWLADHQSKDGYWDVDEFWVNDPKYKGRTLDDLVKEKEKEKAEDAPPIWDPNAPPKPGIGAVGPGMDLPATGLALMAFCGHGCTHRHGKHTETVKSALNWLLKQQNKDTGAFSQNMYIHAICSHAVIELWGVTHDLELKGPAQKATDFLCNAQNKGSGWRYTPKAGSSDSSVSSWCSMAMQTARRADIEVPAENLIWSRKFWDDVTVYSKREGDKEYGEAFYQLNADGTTAGSGSDANTAASILCRIFMGTTHQDRSVRAGAYSVESASTSELVPNIYMWIYCTQGLFQMGGKQWVDWERNVMPAVGKLQVKPQPGNPTGDEGSFWTDTRWISASLGRVGVTAASCIILETYYFYPKIANE